MKNIGLNGAKVKAPKKYISIEPDGKTACARAFFVGAESDAPVCTYCLDSRREYGQLPRCY